MEQQVLQQELEVVGYLGAPPDLVVTPMYSQPIHALSERGKSTLEDARKRRFRAEERMMANRSLLREKTALLTRAESERSRDELLRACMTKCRPYLRVGCILFVCLAFLSAFLWWLRVQRSYNKILRDMAAAGSYHSVK